MIKINMLSSADKVSGQGVGSAYIEQVSLIKEMNNTFDVTINGGIKYDIMHHHTVEPINYLKMILTKGINVAYVHFLPDTLDGSIKLPKIFFGIFKKYVTSFYKKADHLVVVNPIFKHDLIKFGIDKNKITYIPNYVSKEEFYCKNKKEIEQIKNEYNIPKDKFIVLGVGQVQTRKGVKDFIEVAKQNPGLYFVWCGGFSFGRITDGYSELKQIWENPPENVKFLGIIPRSKMNDLYNISDVLFMPSYNELFPMSILEAVNLNKPLLLRNLELYEDILFHKYIYGNNNEEFSNELKKLSSDMEYYKKAQEYSKHISNYYSKEHVSELWKEFYLGIYNNRSN